MKLALAVGLGIAFLAANFAYLIWYLQWESRQTRGMAYYGRPLAGRRALKRAIRRYSAPAKPFVRVLAALGRARATMPSFMYEGVSGPTRVSSPEVFARARHYTPRPEDVFVATQMRCGTTWMQQVVYEIIMRGRGDLTDAGSGHLYAVSPWIDAIDSVAIEHAPLVGDPPTRIIKTHLPASLCPYSREAKYIYVARHPVSCFASIVDYTRTMAGPLAPPIDALAEWFCSDRMYWESWPKHLRGWWDWADARDNVLFVHYEEMKRDFPAVRDRVASFLGCALTPEERRRVDERCSFSFMRDNEEWFEMAPPTMFSVVAGRFMASGKETRHQDVTPEVRDRILEYCRTALADSSYPVSRFYPALAGAAVTPRPPMVAAASFDGA
jgi:hypothetical protein